MLRRILFLLLIALIVIQFFHPQKNISKGTQANYIGNKYNVPDDVKHILAKACNDCHSNNTRYPWYSKIQPVDWWLHKHIVEGKKGLNFDEYTDKRLRYQYKKMEEVEDMVKEGKMPLNSYLWIHKDAKLTADEKQKIFNWTNAVRDTLEAQYPMDSLVRPKTAAPPK
jgi:hypothetical protein